MYNFSTSDIVQHIVQMHKLSTNEQMGTTSLRKFQLLIKYLPNWQIIAKKLKQFSWNFCLIFYNNFIQKHRAFIFIVMILTWQWFSPSDFLCFFMTKSEAEKRPKRFIREHTSQREHQAVQVLSLQLNVLLKPTHHSLRLIIANTMDLQTNSHRHFCEISRYQPHFTEKEIQTTKFFSALNTLGKPNPTIIRFTVNVNSDKVIHNIFGTPLNSEPWEPKVCLKPGSKSSA